MVLVLQMLLCLAAASLSAVTILRVRRSQAVEARTDELCGLSTDTDETSARNGLLEPVKTAAIKVGLISPHHRRPLFLVLCPLAIGLAWIAMGWEMAILAGIGAFILQILLQRRQERRNARQFTEHLPALLERVRQLIVTGKTLQQAFIEVFLTADPEVQKNVMPVIRRLQHGAALPECIDLLARQIGTVELYMLAAFVRTNTKFGGKISDTLVNLINQLSSRARLEREIKAGTAETRASAVILLGLTILVIAFVGTSNAAYMNYFLDTESGRTMLGFILAWPLIGFVVMNRVLKLEV